MPTAILRLLYCLPLLILSVACARRPVALEPLASRSSAYHVTVPDRAVVPVPAQLPGLPLSSLPPALTLPSASEVTHDAYEQAYQELAKMLDGRYPLSFKRAVFLSENAYFDSRLDYEDFNKQIVALSQLCRALKSANAPFFLYDRADKEQVARNAAIFMMMKDEVD